MIYPGVGPESWVTTCADFLLIGPQNVFYLCICICTSIRIYCILHSRDWFVPCRLRWLRGYICSYAYFVWWREACEIEYSMLLSCGDTVTVVAIDLRYSNWQLYHIYPRTKTQETYTVHYATNEETSNMSMVVSSSVLNGSQTTK